MCSVTQLYQAECLEYVADETSFAGPGFNTQFEWAFRRLG